MGIDALIAGWGLFVTPLAIAMTIFGCFLGLIIGVLPGLGPLMGIILLLPAVFHLPPVAAMGALIAIFVGGSCGGAVSAIVLRIPGTPIAAATLLDGYPMAQNGRAGEAIGLAISASAVGGIIGGIILIALAPVLAEFALRFGPPEYFALTLLGLIAIAVVGREAPLKGFIAGVLGLLIATVGTDAISNAQRFTFGYFELSSGFHIVAIVVGLFAISEVLFQVRAGKLLDAPNVPRVRISLFSLVLLFKHPVNLVRSSMIGTFFGSLPGFMAGNPGFVRANSDHVRVLAALSDLESVQEIFGGVPLISESEAIDYPLTGLAPMGWSWYVVRNGTPEERVEVLREAMAAALQKPEVQEYFDSIGRPLLGYPPEDYISTVDAVREQLSTATYAVEWEAEKLQASQ